AAIGWTITQRVGSPGDPRATEIFKMMIADAEQKVKAKQGGIPNERIRIFWADLKPLTFPELSQWLAEEWGAVVVMDMEASSPYTTIDTSTEDTMLMGLAKRIMCDRPMIRQVRGSIDVYLDDIARCVKDYSVDCVIHPGHMGHKDMNMHRRTTRDLCRDLNVPMLQLETSTFDPRYT